MVTDEILKKYNLYRETEEIMEKMEQETKKAQTFEEKKEIGEKQPESRLARVIKNIAEGKIPLEDFPSQLQQIFKVPEATAKKIAKDLEKNVLAFAEKVLIKEEAIPPTRRPLFKPLPVAPAPKEPLETPPPKPKATPSIVEKPEVPLEEKKPKKPDIYREPIE